MREARGSGEAEAFTPLDITSPDILVGLERDGRVRHIDRAGSALLGWTSGEIVGRIWPECFLPVRVRDQIVADCARAEAQGRSAWDCLHPVLCRDGSERLISWHVTVMHDGVGTGAWLLASGVDVTGRHGDAAASPAADSRFRATFEQAAVGMAHVGLDGRFLMVNQALCELTGYDRAELETRRFQDITHPDHVESDLAHARALRVGFLPCYRSEKRYIRKDGSIVWARLMASLARDPSGKADFYVAVVEDIGPRKRAQAQFAAAFEQAAVGMAQCAPDGRYLLVNQKFCELTGYERDELLALTFADLTHPEDLPDGLPHFGALLGGDVSQYSREKRYLRKDGSIVWVKLTVSLVRDENGAPDYSMAVVEDIGARKRAEALRADERLQEMALSAAQAGVWAWDTSSGEQSWSPEMYRIYDLDPAQGPLCFDDWVDRFIAAEDRRQFEDIREGRKGPGVHDLQLEFRLDRPRLGPRWIKTLGRLLVDETGHVRGYGLDLDVTERRLAEETLRESEARLRRAMDAGGVAVCEWDIASGEVTWSDNLGGFAAEDLRDVPRSLESFASLVHPDDRARVTGVLADTIEKGDGFSIEFRLVAPSGAVRWVESSATLIRDEAGRATRLLGVDVDITARKAAADRQRRLTAEYDHRVRNILSIVQAITMHTLSKSPERAALLGRLSALATAHGLLAADNWETVDLTSLVAKELAAFPSDRIAIDGAPLRMNARAAQSLALVLHELATNAAKHGALSGEEGRVDVRWRLEGDDAATLAVDWAESGGPGVAEVVGAGFGTKLIENSVALDLGGTAELRFLPQGLVVRLEMPAGNISGQVAEAAG